MINNYFTLDKNIKMIVWCLFLFLSHLGCDKSNDIGIDKTKYILFVGNSLTYTNDLPGLVKSYAKDKNKNIEADMLALPNYALVDHLADGELQQMIKSKKYQYVVVQQGPSSQAEGRTLLLEAAAVIKELCVENDAQMVIFMVWPAYDNYNNFDGVIKNYSDAAKINEAILCPVGKKWKEYIDATGDLSYYGPDLFHPSLKGSEEAAKIIFESIYE